MGKAAIYNPYLNTLGGGERYTITFANVLAEAGYDVDIEWNDPKILKQLSERFGLKLVNTIKIVDSINRGEKYDLSQHFDRLKIIFIFKFHLKTLMEILYLTK